MKVAIHQPHYFPWLGYLDKMAKVDKFMLMDDVQLTDKSNMFRNKFLSKTGSEKFLTVCFEKKEYMLKGFRKVQLNNTIGWQKDHINFIKDNYKKTPYFDAIYPVIEPVLIKHYDYICDVTIDSIKILRDLYDIHTKLCLQSELSDNHDLQKSDLVLDLCQCMEATRYLSGNGARKYMNLNLFTSHGIDVVYQQFTYPQYTQHNNSDTFVPNLSALDMLFNCGIEQSREIFWNNVNSTHEID